MIPIKLKRRDVCPFCGKSEKEWQHLKDLEELYTASIEVGGLTMENLRKARAELAQAQISPADMSVSMLAYTAGELMVELNKRLGEMTAL